MSKEFLTFLGVEFQAAVLAFEVEFGEDRECGFDDGLGVILNGLGERGVFVFL